MPETAVMIGLASLVYLVTKIAKDWEDQETEMNKGLFMLSMILVIGLEYAGYGIATTNNLGNAADAFLVALLITSLAFVGLTVRMVSYLRNRNQSEGLKGLNNG